MPALLRDGVALLARVERGEGSADDSHRDRLPGLQLFDDSAKRVFGPLKETTGNKRRIAKQNEQCHIRSQRSHSHRNHTRGRFSNNQSVCIAPCTQALERAGLP